MVTVLSDASPLIALGKLNRLHLLSDLFDQVQIPRAVYGEVVTRGLVRGAPEALTVRLFWQRQQWPIVNVSGALLSAYAPAVVLDPGETEVLALAQSFPDPLVLLDDEVARTEARRLGLGVCGTLGVIARAYGAELLSLDQTELLIREIAARPDIWIAAKLCEQVLGSLSDRRPDRTR